MGSLLVVFTSGHTLVAAVRSLVSAPASVATRGCGSNNSSSSRATRTCSRSRCRDRELVRVAAAGRQHRVPDTRRVVLQRHVERHHDALLVLRRVGPRARMCCRVQRRDVLVIRYPQACLPSKQRVSALGISISPSLALSLIVHQASRSIACIADRAHR